MYTAKALHPGDDLTDAFAVRIAVFVDEQGFSRELEIDDTDPVAHHVVLYREGRPVATGRLFPQEEDNSVYVIGRVAVHKEHRGGTGRQLMLLLEQEALLLGAVATTLGAQEQAVPFYEKLGYVAYGESYMDEFCPHQNMKKTLQ